MITNAREISDHADIVRVVGTRIRLKKSGSHYKASCPFHRPGQVQKSPSLVVTPSRGIYKCFSCQVGGDAVSFVMEFDRLEFPDAVEKVAEECGFMVHYSEHTGDRPVGPTRKDLLAAAEQAAAHYSRNLKDCERALEYAHSRGLTDDLIARWNIGYAKGNSIAESGIDPDLLRAIDALREPKEDSKNRALYDPLHGRLIIPLKNPAGRVVGFTGRKIPTDNPNDQSPKYVNTGDTPIFQKGEILFGYDTAVEMIRANPKRPPLIMEGQLKAAAAQAAGYPAIAPGGTSFTDRQAMLVSRMADTAAVAMDRDASGVKACRSIIGMLRAYEMDAECWDLHIPPDAPPDARDPDDLLAANLPIKYLATDWLQWLCDNIVATYRTPGWAREIVEDILPVLKSYPQGTVCHVDLTRLSEMTAIPISALDSGKIDPSYTPQSAAAQHDPVEINTSMTPMRYLCAIAAQYRLDPDHPNPWAQIIPWEKCPATGIQFLHDIALIRQLAARRGMTLAAAIATATGIDPKRRAYYSHWLTVEIDGGVTADNLLKIAHDVAQHENLRRINAGEI